MYYSINRLNSINRHKTTQSAFLKAYIFKLNLKPFFRSLHWESKKMLCSKRHHVFRHMPNLQPCL